MLPILQSAGESLMSVVPFVGLTIATAPGFAHYFGFLRPLAESDGFGAGVVEGLVPAIALTLAMGGAVFAITRRCSSVWEEWRRLGWG